MKQANSNRTDSPANQPKPKARKPIDIASAKRTGPVAGSPLEAKQQRVLELLREGSSIDNAVVLAGATRDAYDKWRKRHEGFRTAANEARAAHRRDVICAFHDADAYARCLIDRIQRAENIKPHIRLRAALALLRRKGPSDWLPKPFEDDPQPEPNESDVDSLQPDFPMPELANPNEANPNVPVPPVPSPTTEPTTISDAFLAGNHETIHQIDPNKQPSEARPPQPPISGPAQSPQGCPAASQNPSNHSTLNPKPSATEGRAHTDIPDIYATAAISANHQQTQPFIVNSTHNPKPPQFSNHTDIQTPRIEQPSEATPSQPTTSGDMPRTPIHRNASQKPSNPSSLNPKPSANHSAEAGAEPAQHDPSDHRPLSTEHGAAPGRTSLDTAFLSHYGVHQHESRHHFHRLFQQMVAGYQPATTAEELTVFRITQKHWILRRIETWERAVADASVSQVQTRHPAATPAGALALQFLQHNDTQQSLFFHRMSRLRIEHEKTLDRLTSHLEIKQHRRKQRDANREALANELLPPVSQQMPFAKLDHRFESIQAAPS